MATLTNPVSPQNIVDRFADFVRATANSGIIYHTGNKPFPEFDGALLGPSDGKLIEITGATISVSVGGAPPLVTANTIYNALVAETNRYTRIRNLHARLLITTGAGNATRSANDARDLTNVAHMAGTSRQGDIGSPANAGVAATQLIDDAALESFFFNLRAAYNTVRGTSTPVDVSVCHSSCHSSCHTSRGRR